MPDGKRRLVIFSSLAVPISGVRVTATSLYQSESGVTRRARRLRVQQATNTTSGQMNISNGQTGLYKCPEAESEARNGFYGENRV